MPAPTTVTSAVASAARGDASLNSATLPRTETLLSELTFITMPPLFTRSDGLLWALCLARTRESDLLRRMTPCERRVTSVTTTCVPPSQAGGAYPVRVRTYSLCLLLVILSADQVTTNEHECNSHSFL